MIRLITHWYDERNARRRTELLRAVCANAANPHIKEFAVLSMAIVSEELPFATVPVDHRPTITELAACGRDDDEWVNVLVNTDCFVEHADTPKLERVQPRQVFCLSRTDNRVDRSQDCWAWRGRFPVDAPFPLGTLGCDNRLAFLVKQAGWEPLNPCLSIGVSHLHDSNVRHYSEATRVLGEYLVLEPCKLP